MSPAAPPPGRIPRTGAPFHVKLAALWAGAVLGLLLAFVLLPIVVRILR